MISARRPSPRRALIRLARGTGRQRWTRRWRLGAALGPDPTSAGHTLVALAVNSTTSLAAGTLLGAGTGSFERHPGLLVMVPAAIGLRGNIFSAVGSRISTAVHTGRYHRSLRRDTVLGDNVRASLALTVIVGVAVAVAAAATASAAGLGAGVSILDLTAISLVGGILASLVVLLVTLALALVAVRQAWDLDSLVAPVVSTVGDVVTVPSLLGAAALTDGHAGTVVAVAAAGLTIAATGLGVARSGPGLRRILVESVPVLVLAGLTSTLAGVLLEHQVAVFSRYPAVLILVPAFVSSAGALGGILTAGLSTRLHLGTVPATALPSPAVRADMRVLAILAVPIYAFNAAGADLVASALGRPGPGLARLLGASLLGASGALVLALAVAYYGAIVTAVRLRVDPDTYGAPITTSVLDFLGAAALVAALGVVGLT